MEKDYNNQNQSNKSKMLSILIFAFVLCTLILSACAANSNSGNMTKPYCSYTSSVVDEEEQSTPVIDLSAFEGDCGVSVKVDIEKESDSHLMDVNILATNTSGKDISVLVLYFVQCYDNNTAIESWEYCDRLEFEDIANKKTAHRRWILSTTILGAREYKVYVAYVLFADGSEWGTEKIDHATVVMRGVEVDVYAYGSGIKETRNTIEKRYYVTYSARVIKNPSVGDSWSFGMKNDDTTFKSGESITVSVPENRGPKLTIFANESDAEKNDFGQKDIVFSDIPVGETETITDQVMVTENDGRYIGNDAYIEFTVTIKLLGSDITYNENHKPVESSEPTANTGVSVPPNDVTYLLTEDMNEFFVHYILPQYVSVQGELHDTSEYDSNESTDWCYKLMGSVGNDKYEAMVYPFQGNGNEITDLWLRYVYWNGLLIVENDISEQIEYSPKKYW